MIVKGNEFLFRIYSDCNLVTQGSKKNIYQDNRIQLNMENKDYKILAKTILKS
ncbi:unnamed protein product [Paramecium primaurelia]|uniref:Uncharacterized protein n=1 Tax=Paramecium primaurelia TaxID=5886 RepID=A0A8S1QUU1_PARPR|nr:unnamed protein product [Paramecium primaurelia]